MTDYQVEKMLFPVYFHRQFPLTSLHFSNAQERTVVDVYRTEEFHNLNKQTPPKQLPRIFCQLNLLVIASIFS